MSTGLHARKKIAPNDGDADIEIQRSQSNEGGADRSHRRYRFFRRFVRSEVGCAIEAVVAFLVVGLFLGYVMMHHQRRKVRTLRE